MPALYYPFHLCHERTLYRILEDYEVGHFRDFMALRLTPFTGTTAYPDRMGDYYPDLLSQGRIVQGYDVSGSMQPEVVEAVNGDLGDTAWRKMYHRALQHDTRFQRGLFNVEQLIESKKGKAEAPPIFAGLLQDHWMDKPYDIGRVRTLSRTALSGGEGPNFEYGWALVKTSAALVYTIRICHQFDLAAITDSASHARLLTQTCQRHHLALQNVCISREGY